MVATTANVTQCLDKGIRATRYEDDLSILFQIAMQCQIIDDVLDYSTDMLAGLPSFLTACKSPSQAYELTRLATLAYADDQDLPPNRRSIPSSISAVSSIDLHEAGSFSWTLETTTPLWNAVTETGL